MMSPAMIELFLRSSGAPKPVIELFKVFTKQGMDALACGVVTPENPLFNAIPATEGVKRNCLWMGAKGPSSRVMALVFLEGMDDSIVQKLASLGVPVVPSVAAPVGANGDEGRNNGGDPHEAVSGDENLRLDAGADAQG